MGVSPTAALNLSDPNTMAMLMQSMARKEGYSNWNSPLAHQAAGAQVSKTHYNIYGGNAQESGRKSVAASLMLMPGCCEITKLGQADGYSFYALSAAEQADRADSPQCCYF
jgi:hypothetical protein